MSLHSAPPAGTARGKRAGQAVPGAHAPEPQQAGVEPADRGVEPVREQGAIILATAPIRRE
jgi:hypothetical protein